MREDIRFYCGIGEQQWNHHPVAPGPYACISPAIGLPKMRKNGRMEPNINRTKTPKDTICIQDSTAFSWVCLILNEEERHMFHIKQSRPSFTEILRLQEWHAEKFEYQVEARGTFDVLIDEYWTEDKVTGTLSRAKKRWSEAEAESAVLETVAAAAFLNKHRNGIPCILNAQGVSAKQYLKCSQTILKYWQNNDIFGFGGFCITGKKPAQIMPVFRETIQAVVPFLAQEGVKRAHIWGVTYAPALGELLYLCDLHGISLSTDSVWPSIKPCKGDWGYASWRDTTYRRPEPDIRGLERARHVQETRDWLANFREREPQCYRFIPVIPRKHYYQSSWLEEAAL